MDKLRGELLQPTGFLSAFEWVSHSAERDDAARTSAARNGLRPRHLGAHRFARKEAK